MYKYAILIDAGFLKKKLGSQNNPVTIEKIQTFITKLKNEINGLNNFEPLLHRIYYYDSPPLKDKVENPLSNKPTNLGSTPLAKNNQQIIDKLKTTNYFAIRLGELAIRGWKLKHKSLKKGSVKQKITGDDLAIDIHQKGVDMRVGLDIATLTLKKQVNAIVLVAGDSDFIPVMKFARKEGCQLMLVTLNHNVKQTMFEHSDCHIKINPKDIIESEGSIQG